MSNGMGRNWFFSPRRMTDADIDAGNAGDFARRKVTVLLWFSRLILIQVAVLMSIGIFSYIYRHELSAYDFRDNWVFSLPGPRRLKEFLEQSGRADLLPSIAIDYGACLIWQAFALPLLFGRMLCVQFGWVKYPFVFPINGKVLWLLLFLSAFLVYPNIEIVFFSGPQDDPAVKILHGRLLGYLDYPIAFIAGDSVLCLPLWVAGRI
jgi:hypothetical protein